MGLRRLETKAILGTAKPGRWKTVKPFRSSAMHGDGHLGPHSPRSTVTFLIRQVCKWLTLTSSHDLERITSRAGAFCACVFDDACIKPPLLTVQQREGSPQPLLCTGRSTATIRGGCSQKHQGHRQQIVRDHVCLSLLFCDIFSRHLGEWPATCLEAPTRSTHNGWCVALAFFRLEVSSSSPLSRPTIAPRTGGRHTQSPGGVHHEISLN